MKTPAHPPTAAPAAPPATATATAEHSTRERGVGGEEGAGKKGGGGGGGGREHQRRPHSYGKDRADSLWKDPKYTKARARVDNARGLGEDMGDLATRTVRELLGRPETSSGEDASPSRPGSVVWIGMGGRRAGTAMSGSRVGTGQSRALSRAPTGMREEEEGEKGGLIKGGSRVSTAKTWDRYNQTDKWNSNNTASLVGKPGSYVMVVPNKIPKNRHPGMLRSGASSVRSSTYGQRRLDENWRSTVPNCGRNTDPYLVDDTAIIERIYVPNPHKKDAPPPKFDRSHMHSTYSGFSYE